MHNLEVISIVGDASIVIKENPGEEVQKSLFELTNLNKDKLCTSNVYNNKSTYANGGNPLAAQRSKDAFQESTSSSSAARKDGVAVATIINTTMKIDLTTDNQACLTTARCDATTTCTSMSTSSAINPSHFVAVQICAATIKIKNAAVIANSTAGPQPSIEAHKISALVVNENPTLGMDGIHNSTAHDVSKNTSNLAIQGLHDMNEDDENPHLPMPPHSLVGPRAFMPFSSD
ncbi:hypothetical protein ACH5RR_023094 [Cinchona calisaya]|uniref:Uncharacterized protein n=1 Tax=Cinchona calisaya TaxID=153742 RepID=A0ABD2Z9P4_9GENT